MTSALHSCVRGVVIGPAGLLLLACGGGDPAPDSVTFAFRMRGLDPWSKGTCKASPT